MSDAQERRNGGRLLGVIIESGDVRSRTALQKLSLLTRETFRSRGHNIDRWPKDARALLAGEGVAKRIVRFDDEGEPHVFAIADCGAFDLFFAVGSRREINVAKVRTGNLASNVLLDVLATPDPAALWRPLYGELAAENDARIWRLEVPAAHIQAHCINWDLKLWTNTLQLDFAVPGTNMMGLIHAAQAAAAATALVRNTSKHKAVAHTDARLSYARSQTHPLVKVHPVTRMIVGYDEDVVEAIRDAVRLLRGGASWDEVAAQVGGRIPAHQARQEPDHSDDDADGVAGRGRSRTRRNTERLVRGLPALPLRFLPDGAPNPEYRPETILDLNRPSERLQALLVRGLTIPSRHAATIRSRIDDDLDGVDPADSFLEFYRTGIYRRLVKDHDRSNSSLSRYKWAALDLGPTADGEFVLSDDDIRFLQSFRTGRTGTGSWGNNPLTGVFRIHQPDPLYTKDGWLDPRNGTFKVRAGKNGEIRGLRLWFEPPGATPHSNGCRSIGWIPNSDIGSALAGLLIDAVSTDHDLGSFTFNHTRTPHDPVAAAEQALADVQRRHETLAVRLIDPDLTELTLAALKRELVTLEEQLDAAHTALTDARQHTPEPDTTADMTFEINTLAQLAAVLQSDVALPPTVAERAARLTRTLLHDPRLTVEPATATIRLDATLMLSNEHGQLTIPLRTRLTNCTLDPWIAGPAGMWWVQRHTPFTELMTARGLATNPASGTRWRRPVEQRLLQHASTVGRPLRGPNLANLIVRCPHPHLLAKIRDAIDTGNTSEQLSTFLFHGDDIPDRARWNSTDPTTRHLLADTPNPSSIAQTGR